MRAPARQRAPMAAMETPTACADVKEVDCSVASPIGFIGGPLVETSVSEADVVEPARVLEDDSLTDEDIAGCGVEVVLTKELGIVCRDLVSLGTDVGVKAGKVTTLCVGTTAPFTSEQILYKDPFSAFEVSSHSKCEQP